MDEPAFPGAVVPSRLIGGIKANQTEDDGRIVRNDRLISVAYKCHTYMDAHELKDLPSSLVGEIEHFWIAYNAERGRVFEVLGTVGSRSAAQSVRSHLKRRK